MGAPDWLRRRCTASPAAVCASFGRDAALRRGSPATPAILRCNNSWTNADERRLRLSVMMDNSCTCLMSVDAFVMIGLAL